MAEQVRTAEKSDEITAIAELLNFFRIQGCIVIIDAMGCQKAITREIIKSQTVRSHWAVENELHGSLDVRFRKDACHAQKTMHRPISLA